eukprot:scaffold555_cov109-Isochrysis_galbana.AAC.8
MVHHGREGESRLRWCTRAKMPAHLPPAGDVCRDWRQGPRVLLALEPRHGRVHDLEQMVVRVQLERGDRAWAGGLQSDTNQKCGGGYGGYMVHIGRLGVLDLARQRGFYFLSQVAHPLSMFSVLAGRILMCGCACASLCDAFAPAYPPGPPIRTPPPFPCSPRIRVPKVRTTSSTT